MPGIKKLWPTRKKRSPRNRMRSRESLRKLMKAAAEVLGQQGVEGTTIRRIAHHAGLTPGAVYRRFHDKDALLETVILRIMHPARMSTSASSLPPSWQAIFRFQYLLSS